MSKIPIFLASNDNYAPFLCTTMYSVLEHTQSFIEFHILDGGIEEENKNLIEQSLKKFENYSIKYYDMSSFDLERFPNVKHYSLNTFSRYFISALAPNIEKLIYIDVDVIVNGDISELYNIDLEGKALAAVPENFYKLNGEYVKEHIKPDFENTENYFNAGVMLLNNKQFVENDYSTRLINMTIELFDKLSCPDQDIYNIMFEHNHKLIDYKFNYMPDFYDKYKNLTKNTDYIDSNAIIYHYTCGKPWKNKKVRKSDLFWKILSKTKFEKQVKETYKDDLKVSKLSIFRKERKIMKSKKYPLVTIISATYNLIKANRVETFLQMVESVKSQTYKNIEHIIVDGGSNDGTLELIKSTGLKYISEPDNGIYDAFNKGVLNANGKYINFLNSDDFFNNKDAVKLSIEKLEQSGANFSFAKAEIIDDKDEFLFYFKPNINKVYSRMPFCHQTMFTQKDVLLKENMFDLSFKSASDYDFIIRLMLKKYKYCEIKENIVSFRLTGESYVNIKTSIYEQIAIFKKLYSKYANLTEKEYDNIIIKNYIPFRLLLSMKIKNPIIYLCYFNYRNLRKNIIQFKFSFYNGIEYLLLFNKNIIKPKIPRKLFNIEEYIELVEEKNQKFPIIFIHRGLQKYFVLALRQAKQFNPNSRIIVIGDKKKELYPDFVEFFDIDNLCSDELEKFRSIYIHSSINNIDYEKFCFERWFIIYNLIKKLNIDNFLHLDSDVFIYCNARKEFNKYKSYNFTYNGILDDIGNVSGHCSFFSSQKSLESFIHFIINFYLNSEKYKNLFNKYDLEEGCINISDMTLLNLYARECKDKCINTFDRNGEYFWDNNINYDLINHNADSVTFDLDYDGNLNANFNNKENIIFKTIHFQGSAKKLMKKVYNKKHFSITKELLKNNRKTLSFGKVIRSVTRKK